MTSTNINEGKAQVRNNERINSGLEQGINVCFDFVVEKWSKYLCICLRPKQWYLELCLVGRIWSGVLKINISSMKKIQGSCINSIIILNHGSLKVCLHRLGWRLFMEFKKSASPKVDQNPEVKSEKKLSLALFIVRWTFHNFAGKILYWKLLIQSLINYLYLLALLCYKISFLPNKQFETIFFRQELYFEVSQAKWRSEKVCWDSLKILRQIREDIKRKVSFSLGH